MVENFRFVVLFFVIFLLTNCFVQPKNYEFIPAYDFYTDDEGRKIAFIEDEDISIELNYEYHTKKEITFFAYFYNSSNKKIEIKLEDIILNYNFYSTSDIDYIPFDAQKELELIKNDFINISFNLVENTYNNFDNLFKMILRVNDSDTTKYSKIIYNFINQQNVAYNSFLEKNYQVEEDENFWQNSVLKSTTLKPKEEIGGLLIFNNSEYKNRLRITIPLFNKYYEFRFKMNEIVNNKN